ncbi:ubiquinol oxidase 4, chloroplastic/chromoplastic-like [Papaver somniferum]|uniref:ubiquinol oxidase 4, chloroplastic/chromoplastic-like n=1 Tax=Papaver somniferum TaxID=3469 RepID=UPI000E6FDA41|nr:ubiquinol oxidase 4, chloroplastic/chromoplastic-like [Papaver somniferum]
MEPQVLDWLGMDPQTLYWIRMEPSALVGLEGSLQYWSVGKGAVSIGLLGKGAVSIDRNRTILQDDEEKVKVEESFQCKSFPGDDGKGSASAEDTVFLLRDYARFFVLETIARVPYFVFMSVLHLYETFGWWRRADYLKVHFAESWNEMHHLLIMEELGGNSWWFDCFLAQHIAVFYYFMIVVMYMISPRMAYHFSECVEMHAFETHDKFLKLQGDELKKLLASEVAVKYYIEGDLYLFDKFQTARYPNSRRPKMENLYDVFLNIRDDEAEHCKMWVWRLTGLLRKHQQK